MNKFTVVDLHCDLLSYLAESQNSTINDAEAIGCALPHLKNGNVKLQVLAIYTPTEEGSTKFGLKQAEIFREILETHSENIQHIKNIDDAEAVISSNKVGVVGAIENASGFCEEDDHLDDGFAKLEKIFELFERTMYITFTHMNENRFGGGNKSNVGLKDDGRVLLEYLDNKKVGVDFSHMSDQLAYDVLNHIDKMGLAIHLLASHSNFRTIFDDAGKRNLPDELAEEIVKRNGIIGANLIKDFMGKSGSGDLLKHINYAFENGYENNIAFGADFFWAPPGYKSDTGSFFHAEHQNASKYQSILESLSTNLSMEQLNKLSYLNAIEFIKKNW